MVDSLHGKFPKSELQQRKLRRLIGSMLGVLGKNGTVMITITNGKVKRRKDIVNR